ncbi:hypothetical protein [Sphingobium cloacae]|uniref:hypothetical protein n=1 Tax=Sphingobium cloacae TaxID=120107 RepID=UPI0009FDA44B|nr:hypothetical protein [Sphingobium cloacae]
MFHADDSSLQALRARAYKLAESGQFDGAHAIRTALIAEGWSNAGRAFQSDYMRKAISERCLAAAKAH